MFPITITIANTAQLNAVMAALALGNDDPKPVAADVKEAAAPVEKPKASGKKEVAATAASPKAGATDAGQPDGIATTSDTSNQAAPTPTTTTAATEPATYQDAAAAITKLSRLKGRDSAVALLKDFGAAKLPDVKPEQFAAVIAAANKAMEA